MKGQGQLRQSQIITTYGPGSLIDLPRYSAIVAGLEQWPNTSLLEEIVEPRLTEKLRLLTGIQSPRMYAPPPENNDPSQSNLGIVAYQFPEWFLVQEATDPPHRERSRRLVHRRALDAKGRFDGRSVVATRFLRACPKGHVDDVDWYRFVHGPESDCPRTRQLWLDERGTGGDLADLHVRCECGSQRSLSVATQIEDRPLGTCQGSRPWLGTHASEECKEPSRLLIRTASNAYFPQVISVLSLPDHRGDLDDLVREMWDDLQIVDDIEGLNFIKRKPNIAARLVGVSVEAVMEAILRAKQGVPEIKPVKHVELDAILSVPQGFGDDVPIDENFHARRLPDHVWRDRPDLNEKIEAVIQVHRLREVLALVGFTRFEAYSPDINGEFETDVARASLSRESEWLPAVENRGEGIFLQLRASAITDWMTRDGVMKRIESLHKGHNLWAEEKNMSRPFPGGPYVLLHTLSHLLVQSMAMKCGYPASSIRERIYANPEINQFGILLYTGSPDSEGTLGGLVQQARYIESHLAGALTTGALCSNDPVCSGHSPSKSLEKRWLQGASCHGCALLAETSCEMRNDYLDRALVVPVLGITDAAFFERFL
ncbi:MAG: hypothetical protein HONBIEJF_00326 [Fimbriimonadaceae bacterium]|nr:hypothetical protein [Fimbriimonadaceae bacterium]